MRGRGGDDGIGEDRGDRIEEWRGDEVQGG